MKKILLSLILIIIMIIINCQQTLPEKEEKDKKESSSSAPSYTVTFDKQSGTGGADSVTATFGSSMPAAAAPVRSNYTFSGYYDAASGGNQYYNGSMTSMRTWDKAANSTLYARWSYDFDSAGITKRDMVSITGGTYTQQTDENWDGDVSDPNESFSHTISSFTMGKYEVTYELWYFVRQWAISNGYTIANPGKEGNDGTIGEAPTSAKLEPVVLVSWRDVIVWCNAYSELSGLTPVYCTNTGFTAYLKTSTDTSSINTTAGSEDNPYVNWSANGYRLPTEGEWQFAASNKGTTPYNYASGAVTYYNNAVDMSPLNGVVDGKEANDAVAVYGEYWNGTAWISTGITNTADVGSKNANAPGLHDMSGNVNELCWDWNGSYPGTNSNYKGPAAGSDRIIRGGSHSNNAVDLQVGYRDIVYPYGAGSNFGFRLLKTQ